MTKLFIDVDGVLFGYYGQPEFFQLRPFVTSFLEWAQDTYDAWWLTAWSKRQLKDLMSATYIDNERIQYGDWSRHKTSVILETASDGDFYWLDDAPIDEELDILEKNGWSERLIIVNANGILGLNKAVIKLCDKTNVIVPHFVTQFENWVNK
jgi:hypothetical protein